MPYAIVLTYPHDEPSVYGPFDSADAAYAYYAAAKANEADFDAAHDVTVVEMFPPISYKNL